MLIMQKRRRNNSPCITRLPAMAGIWSRVVPAWRRNDFFVQLLLEWLYENLGNDTDMGSYTWSTLFAMATWWSWKYRCWNVFGNAGKCRDRTKFFEDLAKDVFSAHDKRIEKQIAWIPPMS